MPETFESLVFYRGVSSAYPTDRPYVSRPRRNRRPRNSEVKFHEIADKWFEDRFGVRYRSQGVFLTSRGVSASAYAASPDHVVRVIPTSDYRYCWSPEISDLLFVASALAEASVEEIKQRLESARYREDGLNDAHIAGHEVMLFCDQYVAIPRKFVEAELIAAGPAIIVPK